jgi:hypothetical protein
LRKPEKLKIMIKRIEKKKRMRSNVKEILETKEVMEFEQIIEHRSSKLTLGFM